MNKSEAIKRITVLVAAYPNNKVSAETFEVYAQMLADLSPEVLDTVCRQCLAESEFFPTIAKLREMALTLTTSDNPTAAEAWGILVATIRKIGFYGVPSFDNPVVEKAVRIMDWKTLCSSENQIADRAHFMRIYEQLVDREKQDARLLPASRELKQLVSETAKKHQITDGSNVLQLKAND